MRDGDKAITAAEAEQLQVQHSKTDLLVWTLYDHPADLPDSFVVRPHSTRNGAKPLPLHLPFAELADARALVAGLGLFRLPRHEGDDPKIIETWV